MTRRMTSGMKGQELGRAPSDYHLVAGEALGLPPSVAVR
jgi:hypothetical protein